MIKILENPETNMSNISKVISFKAKSFVQYRLMSHDTASVNSQICTNLISIFFI